MSQASSGFDEAHLFFCSHEVADFEWNLSNLTSISDGNNSGLLHEKLILLPSEGSFLNFAIQEGHSKKHITPKTEVFLSRLLDLFKNFNLV